MVERAAHYPGSSRALPLAWGAYRHEPQTRVGFRELMTKTARFQELLRSPRLEFLLEAHNGLSARIVEEYGLQVVDAVGSITDQQRIVRRLVAPHLAVKDMEIPDEQPV